MGDEHVDICMGSVSHTHGEGPATREQMRLPVMAQPVKSRLLYEIQLCQWRGAVVHCVGFQLTALSYARAVRRKPASNSVKIWRPTLSVGVD